MLILTPGSNEHQAPDPPPEFSIDILAIIKHRNPVRTLHGFVETESSYWVMVQDLYMKFIQSTLETLVGDSWTKWCRKKVSAAEVAAVILDNFRNDFRKSDFNFFSFTAKLYLYTVLKFKWDQIVRNILM